MNYSELLSNPNWQSKRKEIILRDESSCIHCANLNLIKNAQIGLLVYKGNNENGIFFNFYGLNSQNEIYRKAVFIKKGTYLSPFKVLMPYIGYLDPLSEKETFGKIIGIRLRMADDLPISFFDKEFKQIILKLNYKILDNYMWKHVPALHVHHTYYQINLNPWEYPSESLETLCWVCHEKLHREKSIPFLNEDGKELKQLKPCDKCYGAGWFPQYKHIESGICFQCKGAKYIELYN